MDRQTKRRPISSSLAGDQRLFGASFLFLLLIGLGLGHVFYELRSARAQEGDRRASTGVGPVEEPKGGDGETDVGDEEGAEDGRPIREDPRRQNVSNEVRPHVRKMIRKLLSGSKRERESARRRLIAVGIEALPDLRAWLRHVRIESEKVEAVAREVLSKASDTDVLPAAVSRDSSAALYFERKFLQAEEHMRYGRYDRARSIAEAILELDEGSPLRFVCRRLIRKATERKLLEKLEPRVDIESLVYEIGEKPKIMFRLQNRSKAKARFEIQEGVLGEITITIERRFLGGHKSDVDRRPLRVTKRRHGVMIPAGQGWEIKFPYEIPKDLPLRNCVARIKFRATFRPTRWEIEGERDSNIPLTSIESEFWVIPPGKKRKLEDPLKRLTLALVLDRAEDLLVAGWFCAWGGEKDDEVNRRLLSTLIGALDDLDPKYHNLAGQLLRHASGVHHKTVDDWKKWWAGANAPIDPVGTGIGRAGSGKTGSQKPPLSQKD